MYAIKDPYDGLNSLNAGSYYTGDYRRDRMFGPIEQAKIFKSVEKATAAIKDQKHPMHKHRARTLIVVSVELRETKVVWVPGT